MHMIRCLEGGNPDTWPEPPEQVRKVTEAIDPEAALEAFMGGGSWDVLTYDPDALVREREVRPGRLMAREAALPVTLAGRIL